MTTVDLPRAASRRLDPAGPGAADVTGVRLTFGSLARWSPLVLVAVVFGWSLGSAVPSIGHHDRATVSLALTDEVTWPYYDAVVARQPALFDEAGVRAAAEASVGASADHVDVIGDDSQTNALFWLTVEAADPDDAVALAAAMGDGLVAANVAEQRAGVQGWIDDLTRQIAEREQAITELQRQLDVAKYTNDTAATTRAEDDLSAASDTLAGLKDQLITAQADLADVQPQVEVVAPAELGDDRSDDVRAGLITAAVLGLLAIAVVPTLDRRVARARSVPQLRRIWPDVPVVAEGPGTDLIGDDLASMVELVAFGVTPRRDREPHLAVDDLEEPGDHGAPDDHDDHDAPDDHDEPDEPDDTADADHADHADHADDVDEREPVGELAHDETGGPAVPVPVAVAIDGERSPVASHAQHASGLVVLTTHAATAARIPAGIDVALVGAPGAAALVRGAQRLLVVVPRHRTRLRRLDALADELAVLDAPVRAVVLARR
ncbi:MAG: hypothetical protein U0Q03_13235 [Acidimicrobiales bacterium]